MNNLKKATFGVLVAGIAFGFSAFTTIKKSTVLRYYKTDLAYPNATDPRGYRYFSGDMCSFGSGVCSAVWDIGTNTPPSEYDALPTTGITFQSGTTQIGSFDL